MTQPFMKAALRATLLLTFAPQAPAPPARPGAAPDERPAAEKSNPLRASFGKATHVVVAKVAALVGDPAGTPGGGTVCDRVAVGPLT